MEHVNVSLTARRLVERINYFLPVRAGRKNSARDLSLRNLGFSRLPNASSTVIMRADCAPAAA
ncbi:MAG: hypothetical protein DMG78_30600 [Acidobacteria bacterium]|nr:MAG: hypothetical protein DMG78_30600 [Acidobacteriota bacterium]